MECPFCREKIKNGAILCKHCKSHLSGIDGQQIRRSSFEESSGLGRIDEGGQAASSIKEKKKRTIWPFAAIGILATLIMSWIYLVPATIKEKAHEIVYGLLLGAERNSSSVQTSRDTFLITGRKVGKLSPGMSLQKLERTWGNYRAYKSTFESDGDKEEINIVEIYLPGETDVAMTSYQDEDDNLGDLTVVDSRFHTKEGISIASTIKEIKKAYPDLKIEWNEGYDAWSEKACLSFELATRGGEVTDQSQISAITILVREKTARADRFI